MTSFHLLSIFILTLGAYFFNYVSALNVESLVGGYTASEGTFQHQAAIFARENFSVDIELICNGAIIGPTIVLTAAQCFLGQLRTLKELSFFIIVNSTDLTTSAGVVVDITYIYVPESMESTPFSFLFNDIAIVQTALNMLVLHGCHLKSLKIPMYGESFSWASAEVAGYGDNEITLEAQANSNVRIMVNGKTNYTLNYANVIILGDSECYNSFVRIKLPVDKLMCGVMKTDRPGQHWGLCSNDFGAPLVYNNTVIGIASEHTPDCNDTVSALNVESLIGGYRAPEGTFKYQAAIIAKLNYTRDVFLVCSGGIISPSLILTAAQCFFNDFRRLKDFSFSIIVNSTDLTKRTQLTVNITNIYIPDYHLVRYFTFSTNDIAIAQVEENLFLVFPDSHLQSLNIPTIYGLSYARKTAVVGAYGDHWIILQPNPINAQFTRIEGRSDYKLNYANVTILTDTQCYRNFLPRVKLPIDNLMCGVMLTEHLGQHWGICENDFGAPLVYNNTVIGIATDHTPECNDTVKGGLYIKVSTFTFFLNQVLRHVHFGSNMEDVLVYCNRPHISESQFLVDL